MCRPPTGRGTKDGFRRRIRPITKVPSGWLIAGAVSHVTGEVSHVTGEVSHVTGEVSHVTGEIIHVYKQSGVNVSNIIQCLPPPSNPKSASDMNISVRASIGATDALSGTSDTSRTRVHDQVHTTLALINPRSVHSKAGTISDYINERDVDIICLTETWLNDNNDAVIDAITPDGYNFRHLPGSD